MFLRGYNWKSTSCAENFPHPVSSGYKKTSASESLSASDWDVPSLTRWGGLEAPPSDGQQTQGEILSLLHFVLSPCILNPEEGKKRKKPWIIHEGRGPASAVNSAGVSPLSVAEAFFSPSAVDVGAESQRRRSFNISSGHRFSRPQEWSAFPTILEPASFIHDRDKAISLLFSEPAEISSFHPRFTTKAHPGLYRAPNTVLCSRRWREIDG